MSRRFIVVLAALVWLVNAAPARAATIDLFEWAYRATGPTLVVDDSGFDDLTGLGTLQFTVTGAGEFFIFMDHEIDESIDTFFNEYGDQLGVVPFGLSWEIDEPGYVFGDIYDNYLAGTLDNSNGVPDTAPDDVSMALGWAYDVAAGEHGLITVTVTTTPPPPGFFLKHTNLGRVAEESIYLATSLETVGIPEPAAVLLLGTGLLLLGARVRRRR